MFKFKGDLFMSCQCNAEKESVNEAIQRVFDLDAKFDIIIAKVEKILELIKKEN